MQGKKQSPSNGIWDQWTADKYHKHSPKLAKFLCGYLNDEIPVFDYGCGQGYYLAELEKYGFECVGIEGYKLNNFLCKEVVIHDLTKPFDKMFVGQVLSFETWEHLPPEAEDIYIDTITQDCDSKLIISCATPGQPGVGHINCRDHNYVIQRICGRGFAWNQDATDEIRLHVDKDCDWLERNLLVFDRI